jgi:hypothetical protein
MKLTPYAENLLAAASKPVRVLISSRLREDDLLRSNGWHPGREEGGVLVQHRRGYWSERAAVLRRIMEEAAR